MPVEAVRLKKRCGAKTRQGGQCQRWAMSNGRCKLHGGMSLSGIAHPKYEHGRRMRRLPPRMYADAENAWRDPELASLRDDIVATDARINDLVSRVDSGESGRIWRDLKNAFGEYRKAHRLGDEEKASYWWYEIDDLITNGVQDYDAWDEVVRMQEHKAKLVAQETKRLVQNGSMISAENALAIFGRLMNEIKMNVTDRRALANISRVAETLIAGPVIEVIGGPNGQEDEAS